MQNTLYSVILLCGVCTPAPVDDAIRVDLPVYDHPEVASDVLAEPSGVNYNGEDRSDKTIIKNLLSHKLHAASNVISHKLHNAYAHDSIHYSGIFAPPEAVLEGAILEHEGFGSQKLSIKEGIQHVVAGLLQPKPIVDTIKEEEKYGNSGDKFYHAGKALVGGAEGVSNLVSSVLEVPGTVFKKIAKAATEKLNNIGGRLIGL